MEPVEPKIAMRLIVVFMMGSGGQNSHNNSSQ
jgi:hypothetical protein